MSTNPVVLPWKSANTHLKTIRFLNCLIGEFDFKGNKASQLEIIHFDSGHPLLLLLLPFLKRGGSCLYRNRLILWTPVGSIRQRWNGREKGIIRTPAKVGL